MSPKQGDGSRIETLRELMGAHGNDVLRLLYSYVKDRHLAEDLSQEVFLKAYDHLDSFRNESSYKTWLLRIAANRAKDYLRSAANRVTPVEDLSNLVGGSTPEQTMVKRESDRMLWESVMSLPDIYREALWLFYGHGLSIEEIAVVSQVSVASIKTRLHRGRGLLRQSWEGRELDEPSGRQRV